MGGGGTGETGGVPQGEVAVTAAGRPRPGNPSTWPYANLGPSQLPSPSEGQSKFGKYVYSNRRSSLLRT